MGFFLQTKYKISKYNLNIFSIYKAYYISNQKQQKVDIYKHFKDKINNVFDTNIFRQVKTGNFISKAYIRIFDTFKPITVDRLIVHARGLHARLWCCFFLI
jgi:phosphoglucomutase